MKNFDNYIYDADSLGYGIFAYIMTNRNMPVKLIARSCDDPQQIQKYKTFVTLGLRAHHRTAGVLVYRLATHKETGDKLWICQESCSVSTACVYTHCISTEIIKADY